jgi:hypothetical protein
MGWLLLLLLAADAQRQASFFEDQASNHPIMIDGMPSVIQMYDHQTPDEAAQDFLLSLGLGAAPTLRKFMEATMPRVINATALLTAGSDRQVRPVLVSLPLTVWSKDMMKRPALLEMLPGDNTTAVARNFLQLQGLTESEVLKNLPTGALLQDQHCDVVQT